MSEEVRSQMSVVEKSVDSAAAEEDATSTRICGFWSSYSTKYNFEA